MIHYKSAVELDAMRRAGRLVAEAIRLMAAAIVPDSTTTGQLDAVGEEFLLSKGAVPSFKGYRGYPKSTCISVNSQIIHGIPDDTVLAAGDIVSIDVGAFLDGFHGDGSWTFPVGEISQEAQRLLNVTRESLLQGIAQAKNANRVGDISAAIQSYVENNGYAVVRDLTGHGIGRSLHEEPSVPNFGKRGTGPKLKEGMTFCVEPMVIAGRHQVSTLDDGWTIVSKDGNLSAHFEHTIAITAAGPEILTAAERMHAHG